MKIKTSLAVMMVLIMTSGVQAATTSTQALATWQATAKKDATSKLVVNPLGSISFQFIDGVSGFNTQKGLFDVSIEGDNTATAFKLTSRLVNSTLKRADMSGSTLMVWVDYNGTAVTKDADTTMIDTAQGKVLGNLNSLSTGYNTAGRKTAQEGFTFSIVSGTDASNTVVSDYSDLPDGIWSGDVSVQFDATWTS